MYLGVGSLEARRRRRAKHALDGRGFEQTFEHAAGAPMLEALVRRERVFGTVSAVAELADVERVGLLVLVLEVALERVVAGEGAAAVGALLGLVDASGSGRRHPHRACNSHQGGTGWRRGGRGRGHAEAAASGNNSLHTDTAASSGVPGGVAALEEAEAAVGRRHSGG